MEGSAMTPFFEMASSDVPSLSGIWHRCELGPGERMNVQHRTSNDEHRIRLLSVDCSIVDVQVFSGNARHCNLLSPVFYLLYSVFCILSPVFCLLPPVSRSSQKPHTFRPQCLAALLSNMVDSPPRSDGRYPMTCSQTSSSSMQK